MGRRASGWKLRQRSPGAPFSVRFTWEGEPHEPSTGTNDPGLAAGIAARIYAATISKPKQQPKAAATGGAHSMPVLLGMWLLSISATHARGTVVTYRGYAKSHFKVFFPALHDVTDAGCLAYMRHRLTLVLAATVRQELVGLRSFTKWLTAEGHAGPIIVPKLTKAMLGVPHPTPKRVPAPELSPEEIAAFLAGLPVRSGKRNGVDHPVKARFVVQFATSLRPSTISRLRCPEHWQPGASFLTITRDIDKVRYARRVVLTTEAQAALESACDGTPGPIFGHHEYKHWVRKAAAAAMPEWKADLFAAAHLRSARLTHTIEATGNLLAAQHQAGHKDLKTTSRYARPSERAATNMLTAMGEMAPITILGERCSNSWETPEKAVTNGSNRHLSRISTTKETPSK